MRLRSLSTLLCALTCACSTTDDAQARARAPAPSLSEAELAPRIERGRALLDAGQALEAEAVFAEAAAADGDSLRTRMWVLRAWMDQGRSNETLDALDALDRAGEKGMEMTYLYGMAFARRAEGYLADGVTDSSVQNNFLDATSFLAQAVEQDPVRYRDAFLPLARSAWYVQDLETARSAADRAVEAAPTSAGAWLERGRIAMAEFAAAQGAEPESPRAQALWTDAADSFRRAIELGGAPRGEADEARLAEAATQLGHAMLWKQLGPEATDAYATAIAWNPQGFDYARTVELLRGAKKDLEDERPSGFRAALEEGRARFEAHAAPGDPRTATLLWWLGWARFVDADWSGAEEAFLAAIERAPGQTSNAWFYVGLARQYRKEHEGALQAMRTGWEADPASMAAAIASAGGSLRAFEGLLGWCATQEPPRNLDAAFLSDMLTRALPLEARYWNNLGLFLRDEGERLELDAEKNGTPEPDPALLEDLYGRAYAAYRKALELSPDDPQILNDTALMVCYHIGGEKAEIEAMFRRALELVEVRLAAPDLSEEDRARFEQTRDDIGINLKAVLETDEEKDGETDAAAPDGASAPGTAASDGGE